MPSAPYPSLDQLLPHRAPMIFLDQVIAAAEDRIDCQAHVRADHPLVCHGHLPPSALLEYLAQAAAAHRALTSQTQPGGPRPVPGYLVLISEATFSQAAPLLGQKLEVVAVLSETRPPFFTYDGTVASCGTQLCQARFTVAADAGDR